MRLTPPPCHAGKRHRPDGTAIALVLVIHARARSAMPLLLEEPCRAPRASTGTCMTGHDE